MARVDRVDKVAKALRKQFGADSVQLFRDDDINKPKEVIPTGIEALDHYVLGVGGLPVGRIVELYSEEGAGKAQPLETPVLTPDGWKAIGEVEVGSLVIGSDGRPTTVVGVHPRGSQPVRRISFSDDTSTVSSSDHLWSVWTDNDEQRERSRRVMTTEQLAHTRLFKKNGDAIWRAPLMLPLELPSIEVGLDPYVLGVLLGDGCLSGGVVVSTTNNELADRFIARLPDGDEASWDGMVVRVRGKGHPGKPGGHCESSLTRAALKEMSLLGCRAEDKFVPDFYLWGSHEQRLELLRGLCDTDGYANKGYVEYSTVSLALAEAVAYLARSLGGVARIACKQRPIYVYKGERRVGQRAWRVHLRVPHLSIVTVSKHLARYAPPARVLKKIVSVEPCGDAECVCITVAAPDGLYVTEDFIVTHNSSMAYTFLGAAQRANGSAVMVETEHAFDPTRPHVFGAKVEDLLLMQPDHLGDVLKITESLCKYLGSLGGGPSVLVWDSVAATPTKAEFEGGIAGDAGHGADRARELSRAMRILTKQVAQSRACLVCINQIRENIGVMFGDKYTTAGGRAIKFHASIRLQILGGAKVEKAGEHTGKDVTLMTVKNKLAPPWRKARARLSYENGWDNDWTTLSHAKDKQLCAKGTRVSKKALEEARLALGWPCIDTEGVEV